MPKSAQNPIIARRRRWARLRRWCLSNQRADQIAFTYAPDGYSVLAEVNQTLVGSTTVSNTTETVYLPTASGPMPVVALINGTPFAVYADHLNTPRRLTDAQGTPRWQWAFSGFGKQAAQSIPRTGLPTVSYSLRYPGQVDDGNGLFYNFNRFYDPLAGRYTQADPIGLQGGWNRFGYVGGNALGAVDPEGLRENYNLPENSPLPGKCATPECAAGVLPVRSASPQACFATCFAIKTGSGLLIGKGLGTAADFVGPTTGKVVGALSNSKTSLTLSEILGITYCAKKCNYHPHPDPEPPFNPSLCVDPYSLAP